MTLAFDNLAEFINSCKPYSTIVVFTRLAHYSDDKARLVASLHPLDKSSTIIVTDQIESMNNFRPPVAYVLYDPIASYFQITHGQLALQNSRLHASPYINKIGMGTFVLAHDNIAVIKSVEHMRTIARRLVAFLAEKNVSTIAIDARLDLREFLIAADLVLEIVTSSLVKSSLKWCVLGETSNATNAVERRQYLNFLLYARVPWLKIISNFNVEQPEFKLFHHPMLGDDDAVSLLCKKDFRMAKRSSAEGIVLFEPSVR